MNSFMILNFKKNLSILTILLLSTVFCQAQITINDSVATSANITSLIGLSLSDSCWYESKSDTVNVDFIITIDENNFVKKEKVDYIIHKYQSKKCRFYNVVYDFSQSRIDTFLVNNKPVEILLYKPKKFNYLLVGNIR